MKAVVADFVKLEQEVAAARGKFSLFALFAREDLPDRWDLIVSAPWATGQQEVVDYLVTQIKERIGADKLVGLSRIVVIPPSEPPVQALNRAIHMEHSDAEIKNSDFFGLRIKHAFLITSQSLESPVAK